MDIAFILLLFFSWAGRTVILRLRGEIDEKLIALNGNWWLKLRRALNNQKIGFEDRRPLNFDSSECRGMTSERMVIALSRRVSDTVKLSLYENFLSKYEGDDKAVLEFRYRVAVNAVWNGGVKEWQKWLPVISECYNKRDITLFDQQTRMVTSDQRHIPLEVAEIIVRQCNMFPMALVQCAEEVCRDNILNKMIPVGKVAEKDKWFTE